MLRRIVPKTIGPSLFFALGQVIAARYGIIYGRCRTAAGICGIIRSMHELNIAKAKPEHLCGVVVRGVR